MIPSLSFVKIEKFLCCFFMCEWNGWLMDELFCKMSFSLKAWPHSVIMERNQLIVWIQCDLWIQIVHTDFNVGKLRHLNPLMKREPSCHCSALREQAVFKADILTCHRRKRSMTTPPSSCVPVSREGELACAIPRARKWGLDNECTDVLLNEHFSLLQPLLHTAF